MDQGTLVSEQIDAGAAFVRAFNCYQPIKAAFWLKKTDENQTYLYLASDQINDANFDLAYGEVIRLSNQMRLHDFNPFRVKVLNADKPLARAAVEINDRFPGRLGSRLEDGLFGGVWIDSGYIYSSPLPAVLNEIGSV